MTGALTILIIDDDPSVRESLEIVLVHEGYRVLTASDGEAGIQAARTQLPNLIIVDMMMPFASGFVVTERLKQHYRLEIPIIMLTANDGEHQRSFAEFLGVDRYLNKPIRQRHLLEAVSSLCPGPVPTPTYAGVCRET